MTTDSLEIAKQFAEMRKFISDNNSADVNKLYLIAGTLIGVIVSGLINYLSNSQLFKKQTERDALILTNRLKIEEKNLTRKLASKLFGVHNEYIIAYYILIQSFLSAESYIRLSIIEKDKDRRIFYTNLSVTYTVKVDEIKSKMAILLREFSEIIGEYTMLNESTKVSELYNEFVKTQPAIICDFSKFDNFADVESHRLQLILKYNKVIGNELDFKGIEIFKCMTKECGDKFKAVKS